MPKAILKNGIIYPLEPLPLEWQDGMEVQIEKLSSPSMNGGQGNRSDQWMAAVEAQANLIDPENDKRLDAAIRAIRKQAKEAARRKAGQI